MVKHIITWATFALPMPVLAEFPAQKVEYICDVASYYITTDKDECMLEQYGWYQEVMELGLTEQQYNNALWYGQRYGYMGDVMGIDFKYVLDRAKYLTRN